MTAEVPWLTLGLTGATVALFVAAGTPEALLLTGDPEPWRWVTGHLVHLSPEHLLWDGLAFAVLGSALEMRSRRTLLAVLGTAALAISAFVVWALPHVPAYAGLSGIDAALTAAVAVTLLRGRDWKIGAVLAAAFAAKLIWEQVSGGTLLAGGAHATSVHLVGAVVGVLASVRPHEGSGCRC